MFLLPLGVTGYALSQVRRHGEFEVKFKKLPDSVVEIYLTGGRQSQYATQSRIGIAGFTLAMGLGVTGFMTVEDKSLFGSVLVLMMFTMISAAMCVTPRRTLHTKQRQFVTDYLLFNRWRLSRRRWQVRGGDSLTIFAVKVPDDDGKPEFAYQHLLCVCHGRWRQVIASADFTGARAVPGMETAARRIAKWVGLPYVGYRESKGFWWTIR